MYNPRRHTGITLLETLLVLAIASIVIILSLRFARYYTYRSNVTRFNQAVEISFLLANQYYRANCQTLLPPQILATDFNTLTSWGGDFSSQEISMLQNLPFAGTFSFAIADIHHPPATKPLYAFVLSATFPGTLPTQQLVMLQTELNADQTINDNTLTWTRLPGILAGKGSENLWIASSALQYKASSEQTACPL